MLFTLLPPATRSILTADISYRSAVFNRPRKRAVVLDTEDSDKRLILLREDVGELGALLCVAYSALLHLLSTAECD